MTFINLPFTGKRVIHTNEGFKTASNSSEVDATFSYFQVKKEKSSVAEQPEKQAGASKNNLVTFFLSIEEQAKSIINKICSWATTNDLDSTANIEQKIGKTFAIAESSLTSLSTHDFSANPTYLLFENKGTDSSVLSGKIVIKQSLIDNKYKLIFVPFVNGRYDEFGIVLEEYEQKPNNDTLSQLFKEIMTTYSSKISTTLPRNLTALTENKNYIGGNILKLGYECITETKKGDTSQNIDLIKDKSLNDCTVLVSYNKSNTYLQQILLEGSNFPENMYILVKSDGEKNELINKHFHLTGKIYVCQLDDQQSRNPIIIIPKRPETAYTSNEIQDKVNNSQCVMIDGREGAVGEPRGSLFLSQMTAYFQGNASSTFEEFFNLTLPLNSVQLSASINRILSTPKLDENDLALYLAKQIPQLKSDTEINNTNISNAVAGKDVKLTDKEYQLAVYLSLAKILITEDKISAILKANLTPLCNQYNQPPAALA